MVFVMPLDCACSNTTHLYQRHLVSLALLLLSKDGSLNQNSWPRVHWIHLQPIQKPLEIVCEIFPWLYMGIFLRNIKKFRKRKTRWWILIWYPVIQIRGNYQAAHKQNLLEQHLWEQSQRQEDIGVSHCPLHSGTAGRGVQALEVRCSPCVVGF